MSGGSQAPWTVSTHRPSGELALSVPPAASPGLPTAQSPWGQGHPWVPRRVCTFRRNVAEGGRAAPTRRGRRARATSHLGRSESPQGPGAAGLDAGLEKHSGARLGGHTSRAGLTPPSAPRGCSGPQGGNRSAALCTPPFQSGPGGGGDTGSECLGSESQRAEKGSEEFPGPQRLSRELGKDEGTRVRGDETGKTRVIRWAHPRDETGPQEHLPHLPGGKARDSRRRGRLLTRTLLPQRGVQSHAPQSRFQVT